MRVKCKLETLVGRQNFDEKYSVARRSPEEGVKLSNGIENMLEINLLSHSKMRQK